MKLKRLISVVLLHACVLSVSAQVTSQQAAQLTAARRNLMPVPASVQFGAGRLAVTKSFTVAGAGHVDERLRAGVDRAMRRLAGRTVLGIARGASADAAGATLVIECKGRGRAVLSVEEDESYTLDVTDRQAS